MLNRFTFFGLIFLLLFFIHCQIFEPQHTPGSLKIVLIKDTENLILQKSTKTVNSVQCIVKKGVEEIYNRYLTLQGNSFHGEINGLGPGNDYSVLLYGQNIFGKIIFRGYESGISVNAGNQTIVTIFWSAFTPELISPANNSTISTDKPDFEWNSVSDAIMYEIMVSNNDRFIQSIVIHTNSTTPNYKALISLLTKDILLSHTFYWRVRAKDSEGNWGMWSETWSFHVIVKSITVNRPNGGERWEVGSLQNITWMSNAGGYVKIELYKESSKYETITLNTENDGSYNWNIPTSYTVSDDYRIKIISTSNSSVYDFSSSYFSLKNTPSLRVIPNSLYFDKDNTSETINISNNGGGTLTWSVSTEQSWITVIPSSGSTTMETDFVTVQVNRSMLEPKNYIGTVMVSSNGGNQIISISMIVEDNKYPGMVYIPAGEFLMGSNEGNLDEQPAHKIYLDAYYIDKYEVTNTQYSAFLNEALASGTIKVNNKTVTNNGYVLLDLDDPDCQISFTGSSFIMDRSKENHPVINVTWYGANAYSDHYGKRLPTEAEWEKAARGLESRKYPWGNNGPTSLHCNFNNYVGHTTPVGQYSPTGDSPYGCCDMAGNVWEWCADWYDKNYYSHTLYSNPQGPSSGSTRVLRSGSWMSDQRFLRCTTRVGYSPVIRDNNLGFRCARSP